MRVSARGRGAAGVLSAVRRAAGALLPRRRRRRSGRRPASGAGGARTGSGRWAVRGRGIGRRSVNDGWGRTLCPYCGVGCGLLVRVDDGRVTKVKGDPDHPASLGDLCAKAVHLPPVLRTDDRLLYPEVRARRDAERARVPWEWALRFTADRFREIVAAHGPDAVAFYASGQLTTEEYYVASKLAKGFVGTNNFDTNSRLCMASAAAGYTRSLGADGPPASYADLDEADAFFLIGTNTADCHPVTFK